MKVASAIANIRPHCDVHLVGYVGEDRQHVAKGIHDDPLAISLLLEINGKRLLFVSIDVIILAGRKAEILRKKICHQLHLDEENVILNAIHSHSLANGFCDGPLFGIPDNNEYFQYACDQILLSLQGIEEKLENVTMEIGTTKVHGFYSKRTDVTLPFDDHAAIIKFIHDDRVIAAMCNINCHATVLGPKNMLLSSDLIGEVRRLMAQELGVIPFTFTGASGDISNRQFRQGNDFSELERVGQGIAGILKDISHYHQLRIKDFCMKTYDYHIAYDNTLYYSEYQKGIDEANAVLSQKNISLDEWKMRTSEKLALEEKMKTKNVDFHVKGKILHMDELTIVTYPGELASRFGLELRKKCQTPYFLLIGYADDYQGYFIEEEEYGKTYETKASNTPKGETEKIVKKIGDLL